jgi:hypothetical protein
VLDLASGCIAGLSRYLFTGLSCMEERMKDREKTQAEKAELAKQSRQGVAGFDDRSLDKLVGDRRADTEVQDISDRYASK